MTPHPAAAPIPDADPHGVPNAGPDAAIEAILRSAGADLASRFARNVPLGSRSWFGAGGRAAYVFAPRHVDDVVALYRLLPAGIPIQIVGRTSNLLIRDGGLPGIVVRLTEHLRTISRDPGTDAPGPGPGPGQGHGVICDAGASDMLVAEFAADAGLGGLDFLIGIPGSIGGAVAMNAGAQGRDMSDIVDWVEIVDRSGILRRLSRAELGFTYRHARLSPDDLVVRARLVGHAEDPDRIRARMAEHKRHRQDAQPVRARTGGSTFRNPESTDGRTGRAWELIDAAGCRDLRIGDAAVSGKHCNFLVNLGHASATEIEALGEEVRRRVLLGSGIDLRWEIVRVGRSGTG